MEYPDLLPVCDFHLNAVEHISLNREADSVANDYEKVDTEVRLRVLGFVPPHTDREDSSLTVLLEYEFTCTPSDNKFLLVGDLSQFDFRKRCVGSTGWLSLFRIPRKDSCNEEHRSQRE